MSPIPVKTISVPRPFRLWQGGGRRLAVLGVLLLLCCGALLPAATTRTWTGGGGAGDVNWMTASNWGGTAPVAGDDLVFAGTPASLTTTNNFTATSFNSISFSSGAGAFILNGNALTLVAGITNSSTSLQTINVAIAITAACPINAASGNIAISGIMSGTGATLTKSGTGTVTCSGANSFTGTTTVSAGVLVLQSTYASATHSIAAGAVLELNVASGTRDLATTTFTGAGTLRKTGAGTALWGGSAATFALGSLGVTTALIDVQAGGMVGGSSANEVWTNNYADLTVATGATFTGVEANVRVNALSGGGTIQSGYGGAGYVCFTFGVNNGGATFTGVLANASTAGLFVKEGTGTQALTTSANTHSGGTTVNNGALLIGSNGNQNSAGLGTGPVTVNTGGVLWFQPGSTGTSYPIINSFVLNGGTIRGEDGIQRLATGAGATFAVGASGGTIQTSWPGKDVYIDGILSGTTTLALAHGTTVGGASTIHLTNAANSFSGTVTVNSATNGITLSLDSITALQYATINLNPVATAGTLQLNVPNAVTVIAGLTGTGGTVKPSTGAGNYTLNVNTTGANVYGGTLIDNTGVLILAKSGTGSLSLGGTNTYSGGTTITAGKVVLTALGGLGTGPVTHNATLNLTVPLAGDVTYTGISNTLSGTGTVNVRMGTGSQTVLLNGNYTNFTGTWNLGNDGEGNVAGAGAGKVQMTGADNPAATINVLANATLYTLNSTRTATLYLYGGDTGESLGQLRIENGTWAGSLVLAGAITGANDGHMGSTSTGTISGVISETGGSRILVIRNGTIILTNVDASPHTYTGGTTISSGTLQIGSTTATGSLPAGNVIDNGALVFKRSDTALVVANAISGTGTITADGGINSLVSLSGTNTFTGGVTITSGGLRITNSSALGSGAKTLIMTNGSAGQCSLRLDGTSGAIVLGSNIALATSSSGGTWGGIINVAGTNTINGVITLNSGGGSTRCRVDAGTLTLAGNVTTNTTLRGLVLDGAGNGVFSGAMDNTNAPTLTKLGAGTWTMSGANAYTGATTVTTGTLLVSGSTAAGSTVTVGTGATLGGSGTVNGPIVLGAGGILAPGLGTTTIGTLAVAGVTCNATSVWSVDLDGTGPTADLVTATGIVSLNGTLTIASIANPGFNKTYTIATGNVNGTTFAGLPEGASFTQQGRRFIISYLAGAVTLRDVPSSFIWTGASALLGAVPGNNNKWSTAANWDNGVVPTPGSDLVFQGPDWTTADNDIGAGPFASISFSTTAAAFTLIGDAVTLTGGITNSSALLQTINLDMTMAATRTFNTGAGGITCGGILDGAGGLTKTGAGILSLDGANTYAGTTTLSAGTLLVQGGITGNVTAVAATTLGGAGTITGNVTSAGAIVPRTAANGTAVLTVDGSVSCSGTMTFRVNNQAVTPGTDHDQLVVNGFVNLSGAAVTVTGNANNVATNQVVTLILNDGVDALVAATSPVDGAAFTVGSTDFFERFNGGSGNDLVLIQGSVPSLVYVDNVNFAAKSPGQAIEDADQGTLASQSAIMGMTGFTSITTALGVIATPGSVTVNSGTYNEDVILTGSRSLVITGPDALQSVTITSLHTSLTDPFATPAGQEVQIAGNSALLIGSTGNATISCPILGTGNLVKQGTGTLTLNGTDDWTGATAIDAGTLVAGSLASSQVTVASGATLQITGTMAGSLISNGSVRVNAGAIGLLHVDGNVDLNASSTWKVDLDGATMDQLTVAGTVTIAGSLQVSSFLNPVGLGTDYPIISAGTVLGTFAGLPEGATILINGRLLEVRYGSGTVTLRDLNSAPVLDVNVTPALDSVSPGAPDPVGTVGTRVSSLVDLTGPLNNVSDANAGSVTGIAVTAVDGAFGAWWFSLDGGTTWTLVGTVTEASALLLPADALTRVYFAPQAGWSGMATMTFRAWDQTNGTAALAGQKVDIGTPGGSSPYSLATDQVLALVGKTWVNITLIDQVYAYDGTPKVAAYTASPDVACAVTYTDWNTPTQTPTATAPTAPGTYSVTVTVTAANYLGQASAWLTITAPPAAAADSGSSGGGCGSGSGLALLLALALLALFRLTWAGGIRRD